MVRALLIAGKPPNKYALSLKRLTAPSTVASPAIPAGTRVRGVVASFWAQGNGATVLVDQLLTGDDASEALTNTVPLPLYKADIAEDFVYDAHERLEEGDLVEAVVKVDNRGKLGLTMKPPPAVKVMYGFAYLGPQYRQRLTRLADMAQSENEHWDYVDAPTGSLPILDAFIKHTFAKVYAEGAVQTVDRWAAFNTGLMRETYEDIFGVFDRVEGKQQPWHFRGFYDRGAREMVPFRDAIPRPANYWGKNHAHMMYELDLSLEPVNNHIIKERGWRLPPVIQGGDEGFIARHVKAAVDQALHRVRMNYKTAIPHKWYLGRLGLLLPLRLTKDQRKTDVALAVSRERARNAGADFYRGSTTLPLDWAYRYARLIARPDPEWLTPIAPPAGAGDAEDDGRSLGY